MSDDLMTRLLDAALSDMAQFVAERQETLRNDETRLDCEMCKGPLNQRKFPNVTHGRTVCTACSEVLQARANRCPWQL